MLFIYAFLYHLSFFEAYGCTILIKQNNSKRTDPVLNFLKRDNRNLVPFIYFIFQFIHFIAQVSTSRGTGKHQQAVMPSNKWMMAAERVGFPEFF